MTMDQSDSVRVIEAGMQDLDLVVPLFDRYRRFYGQSSDLNLAQRFVRARVEHRDSVIYLALDGEGADEMALGFALLYPSFDSVLATPIWILNDLYVLEGVRRRGIAKILIAQGRQLAENTGACALSLATAVDNAPSRKLYEALGFELDARFCTYLLHLEPPTE